MGTEGMHANWSRAVRPSVSALSDLDHTPTATIDSDASLKPCFIATYGASDVYKQLL